jgi:hypothetical protein
MKTANLLGTIFLLGTIAASLPTRAGEHNGQKKSNRGWGGRMLDRQSATVSMRVSGYAPKIGLNSFVKTMADTNASAERGINISANSYQQTAEKAVVANFEDKLITAKAGSVATVYSIDGLSFVIVIGQTIDSKNNAVDREQRETGSISQLGQMGLSQISSSDKDG